LAWKRPRVQFPPSPFFSEQTSNQHAFLYPFIASEQKRDHLMMHHLFFSVDLVRCALPLASVRVVLQMVQLGPVAESRPGLAGSINLHGQIILVYSVRSFFGIPDRAPQLTDKLIVAQAGPDCIALWVDETHVIQQSPVLPAAPAESVEQGQPVVPGVDLTVDGTYLFVNLFRFLETGNTAVPGATHGRLHPHRGDSP
jgi:chemotaxis signal transduction protein